MNAMASSTGSVTGRLKNVHELRECRPDRSRALDDRRLPALGVLQDRQQQREADALEERERHRERDEPDDLGRLDIDDGEHAPDGVDAQVLVEELGDSRQQQGRPPRVQKDGQHSIPRSHAQNSSARLASEVLCYHPNALRRDRSSRWFQHARQRWSPTDEDVVRVHVRLHLHQPAPRRGRASRTAGSTVMAELARLGANVRFLCLMGSPAGERARKAGIDVDPYILDKWNVIRSHTRLRKYLKRYVPVAVHSTGLEADLLSRWAARKVPQTRTAVTLGGDPQGTRRHHPDRPAHATLRRARA